MPLSRRARSVSWLIVNRLPRANTRFYQHGEEWHRRQCSMWKGWSKTHGLAQGGNSLAVVAFPRLPRWNFCKGRTVRNEVHWKSSLIACHRPLCYANDCCAYDLTFVYACVRMFSVFVFGLSRLDLLFSFLLYVFDCCFASFFPIQRNNIYTEKRFDFISSSKPLPVSLLWFSASSLS